MLPKGACRVSPPRGKGSGPPPCTSAFLWERPAAPSAGPGLWHAWDQFFINLSTYEIAFGRRGSCTRWGSETLQAVPLMDEVPLCGALLVGPETQTCLHSGGRQLLGWPRNQAEAGPSVQASGGATGGAEGRVGPRGLTLSLGSPHLPPLLTVKTSSLSSSTLPSPQSLGLCEELS